jgi:hypothetical protein
MRTEYSEEYGRGLYVVSTAGGAELGTVKLKITLLKHKKLIFKQLTKVKHRKLMQYSNCFVQILTVPRKLLFWLHSRE